MNFKELVDQLNQIAGEKIAAREFTLVAIKSQDAYGYITATIDIDGVKYKGSFKENSHMWHMTYGECGEQFNPVMTDEQATDLYHFFETELDKQELEFWTAEKAKAEEHLKMLENKK